MLVYTIKKVYKQYKISTSCDFSNKGRDSGQTLRLILAGTLANWGDEANVVSSSMASMRGCAASAQLRRFWSLKSLSNSCNMTERLLHWQKVTSSWGMRHRFKKIMFYIAQYPVRWTIQNALHFTPWQTCSFRHQLSLKQSSHTAVTRQD